jgi:hypothetical protein
MLINMRETDMKYVFTLVLSVFLSATSFADSGAVAENLPKTSMHLVPHSSSSPVVCEDEVSQEKTTEHRVQANALLEDFQKLQELIGKNRTLASYALGDAFLTLVTMGNLDDAFDRAAGLIVSTAVKVVVAGVMVLPADLMGPALSHLQGVIASQIENPVVAKSAAKFGATFALKMKDWVQNWAQNTLISKAVKAFKAGWSGGEDVAEETKKGFFSKVTGAARSCRGMWNKFKETTVTTVRTTIKTTAAPTYAVLRSMVV